MSVEELRELADRLRKGRLVQQSRMAISTINGMPVEVSAGEVREHAHPDAIAAADAIEWLLADRHQVEESMRERCLAAVSNYREHCSFDEQLDAADEIEAAIRSIDTRGE